MENPSLSIVVPAFNEEAFIGSLLEDILNSTYKDCEVIVCDNKSTDKTREIIESYAKKHSNIKYVHEKKQHPAHARNKGASESRGEYILFLDGDSRISKTFLENSVTEMKKRNLDIAGYYIKPSGKNLIDKAAWFIYNNFLFRPLQYVFPLSTGGGGIIAKKELHEKINGFNPEIIMVEDHDYVRRGSSVGKFRMIKSEKAEFNMRKFDHEGRGKVYGKWTLASLFYILRITKWMPFKYELGGTDYSKTDYSNKESLQQDQKFA